MIGKEDKDWEAEHSWQECRSEGAQGGDTKELSKVLRVPWSDAVKKLLRDNSKLA